MKFKHLLYLSAVLVWFSACSSKEVVETKEDFAQVELPDSSIVYLNHNSKLTYDKNFNPRRVKLEGDAFFSVNDGETPFVIESGDGEETTVLGTEFWMAVSSAGVAIEVEIGVVSLRIGSLYRECGRGRRLDWGRHDNGLHLGQAKHRHRSWIGIMEKDFRKNGKVMKRSYKHSLKGGGNSKPLLKGGGKPKAKPKSGGGGGIKKLVPKSGGKNSKSGGGGGKKGAGKTGKKGKG